MDCYVSFSTSVATGSTSTANLGARVLLPLVISFTRPTRNGNLLSVERAEGSAMITRLDARRVHPPVDVTEGGRHRSIASAVP